MNRLLYLDGLRAIAILSVMMFHYFHVYVGKYSGEELLPFSFGKGGFGVNMFFVISGFVIFMTVERKDLKSFVISRITRLYPTYLFSVLFTTFIIVLIGDWYSEFNLINFLKNITMFQYYFGGTNIDGVYWSLRVEIFFYIIISLIFYSFDKKFFWPIFLVISLFSLLLNTYYSQSSSIPLVVDYFRKVSTVQFLPFFIVGMCIYSFCFKYRAINDKKSFDGLCVLLSLTLALLDLFFNKGIELFFTILSFGMILWLLCVNKLKFLRLILESKILLFFGRISYSLYLIHQVIGYILISFFVDLGMGLYSAIILVCFFVIFISHFMQLKIECFISNAIRLRLQRYAY